MSQIDSFINGCGGLALLAQGGQKKVYSASHPVYGGIVVKVGMYGVTSGIERITREVQLLSQLNSPFYPKQHDFLVEPLSQRFLIAEEKLNAVELSHIKGEFADDVKIVILLRQLVVALNEIWSRRVVHRDLKPANILICPNGEPRIIDLGIARFLEQSSLTETIAISGPATPMYSAPEQLKNQKSSINHRTDFFNLGILAAELMLGFHPFDPTRVGGGCYVDNIVSGNFVMPDDTRSAVLRDFVGKCLEVKPHKRFRTPTEISEFLQLGG